MSVDQEFKAIKVKYCKHGRIADTKGMCSECTTKAENKQLINALKLFVYYHNGYDEEMGVRLDGLIKAAKRLIGGR